MEESEPSPDSLPVPEGEGADHLAFLGEKADGSRPSPSYRLYSSWSVGVATFFGSLAGGGLILACNYWRLRRRLEAILVLAAGMAATAGLVTVYILFTTANDNGKFTRSLGGMGLFFVAGTGAAIADMLQGKALRRHEMSQGKLASPWSAMAIGLSLSGLACLVGWQVMRTIRLPQELCDAGLAAAEAGDEDRAETLLNRVLTLRPNLGMAWLQRGMIRARRQEFSPALADLDKAVEFLPDSWKAHLERGRIELQLGRNEEAVADLSQALRQISTPEAYYMRAIGRLRCKQMREAALDCSLALRLEIRPEYLLLRAACYDALGEPAKAAFDRTSAEAVKQSSF